MVLRTLILRSYLQINEKDPDLEMTSRSFYTRTLSFMQLFYLILESNNH